jgi:putative acetyltransferase
MIDIRDESPQDWNAVYQVISSAFGQPAEAELVEKLREAGDSVVSLVAEEDGEIVGHVLLSRMDAPFPALALAPVSVIPAKQRGGIGALLIEEAVNRDCYETPSSLES